MKFFQTVSYNIIYLFFKLANKRGLYDIYGSDGLRSGILDKDKNLKGGYKYGGNAYVIFEKFFGTTNPFALIKDGDRLDDEYGSMFNSAFGGQYAPEKELLPNVEVNLECTLEELYNGCVKKLKYERKVLNSDGRTTLVKEDERDVEIFKGYDKSTVLTFPSYGDEAPGMKNCKF
jgi:DnaJ family protein B protein 13